MKRGFKSQIRRQANKLERNFDAPKLDTLQRFSNLPTIREQKIYDELFSTQNHIREPDITIKPQKASDPVVLCEHDTVNIHGDLGYESEKTMRRNRDYKRTKRPFFVVNADLCREIEKLIIPFETKIMLYLYYHTISQWRAEQ